MLDSSAVLALIFEEPGEELRSVTRSLGLSVRDRACLALARERNLPAMTSDTSWGKLPNFNVILIRNPA